MADAKRARVKRKQLKDDLEKPTKEEYAVAKFLRFNAPSKEGKYLGNNQQYFIGSKAIDTLLESKWATAKGSKSGPLFTNRSSCANYCERLLEKGFFQRAARPEKKKKIKGGVSDQRGEKAGAGGEVRQRKEGEKSVASGKEEPATTKKADKKTKKEESPRAAGTENDEEKSKVAASDKSPSVKDSKQADGEKSKEDTTGEEKKRKKKKLKLEPHERQVFIDGTELYVWLYEPVQAKTFIIGLLLVLGAIAVCLFPLWPPEVRLGVYYLSLAAAGFVGVILSLCIIRMIVFCIVWGITLGKISFWLLPNLTEDVGFFDSFRPAYNCQYNSASTNEESASKTSASGEDKEEQEEECNHGDEEEREVEEIGEREDRADDDDDDDEGRRSGGSTNSYEIVDATEMDDEMSPMGQEDSQSQSEEEEECSDPKKTK